MGPNSGTQWSLLIVLAKEMTDMCVPYRQTAGLLLLWILLLVFTLPSLLLTVPHPRM